MGRIRTIKPEFPHSESVGKLSREARLLFVLLWTLVDDAGRARAASRMLASLLYPYDDDAPALMTGWLAELESNNKIRIYNVDGSHYLEICNWLEHQKIDHPTKSRLPECPENSAKAREDSRSLAPDLGPVPRTVDRGPVEAGADAPPPKARATRLEDDWKPSPDDLAFASSRGLSSAEINTEGIKFRNYWTAKSGKDATKLDWPRTWQNWILNHNSRGTTGGQTPRDQSRDRFREALNRVADFGATGGDDGGPPVRLLPAAGRG